VGADVLFKAPGATSRPLLDDSGTVKHPMANSTVSTHWPFGALGPRIHNFPISARFRARRIVTRARAAASAGRSAFRVSSSFLVRPLQPGQRAVTVTVLAVWVGRAC